MSKIVIEPLKNGLHRLFFPNGKISHQFRVKGGVMHGVARAWHENGRPAEEKHYQQGLLHGTCKQWNKDGKLLGSFRIRNGTGISFGWHPNGQLECEISLVDGKMTGRLRIWGDDGVLIVQKFHFENRPVSKRKYDELCGRNPELPRFPDERATNTLGRVLARERKERCKDVQHQLAIRQRIDAECAGRVKGSGVQEARKWLTGHGAVRQLGDLTVSESRKLIRELYELGASKVWAVDMEVDPDGSQYSNKLIARLPVDAKERDRIYEELAKVARPFLGIGSPAVCVGERYVSVSIV